MKAGLWLLRAAWMVLAAVLLLQCVQLVQALRYLAGPEAFAVSPLLWAALALKGALLLLNLGLLLAVRWGLGRLLRRKLPTSATTTTTR